MKRIIMIIAGLAVVGLTEISFAGAISPQPQGPWPHSVIVYKAPTCGCCANYISYLRSKKYSVTVVDLDGEKLKKMKSALGVPSALDSCHTTVAKVGNYFAEGHIPYEVIDKLLSEKPQIRGIGIAGMPSGSPGMPGGKKEPFIINQVKEDGKLSLYLIM